MVMTTTLARMLEEGQIRRDLHALESRLIRQRDALLALTTEPLDGFSVMPRALSRIIEVASTTLCVRRVSIWRYNSDRTAIDCVDLFDALTAGHAPGGTLRAADYPHYFQALTESDVVAVDDAVTDPRTSEFAHAYLRPLNIVSMMDVPIHRSGAVVGVVCHEHTGTPRNWTVDEKAFAIGISNLIALAFERSDRARAESAIRLQGAALNAAAHPIVVTDRDANIVYTNEAFTTLTGYTKEEAIGRNSIDLLNSARHDPRFFNEMWETLKAGRVWRGEISNRRKDGSVFLADQTVTPVRDAHGSITHYVAIKVDLTHQRNLEGQFLQAQKMEVVGRLAGGIAHDFNNLLTVINGTAELALTDLPKSHPLRSDFERIQESGKRAAGLTRQLLTFSRKQIVSRGPLEIEPVLTGFKSMLQRLIGEDISLAVRADVGRSTVLADQGQIEQVILNLAVNARDAMPSGGRLAIEAANVELDGRFAETHPKARPGSYVRITVTDTGEGMSEDVLSQIFEPFFTTKESGKGTGLGLATVYAIVEQSGGTIWVSSTLGIGTMFTIYLPRVAEAAPAALDEPESHPAKAGETILVVEDDGPVRELAVRILRAAGYVALPAADAVEALRILSEHPDSISLIVTDVVLTGMGGRELASHADTITPGIPVLFTSGHTDDLVLAHGVRENLVHFIGKPYTTAALTNKVRGVLNGTGKGQR